MPVKRCLSSPLRRLIIALFTIVTTGSAYAHTTRNDIFPDVYVTIKESKASLAELFKLIQRQTELVFIYDDNEIDPGYPLNLPTGDQRLSSLLDNISAQTGLLFTQKQNNILVSKQTVLSRKKISFTAIPVKGSVKDAAGLPLSGATITVKGTQITVQTDREGNFSMSIPDSAVLVISFVGYLTQEITANNESIFQISMDAADKSLNEVVVVGYQSRKRSELTGAISVINVSDLSKQPVGGVDQALQGKASGVRITQSSGQPGEGIAIRIRGVGTINNNDPLFIIDGIPTKDGINFLSSNDIESITVLKDAASAAIYGARSANGVIVITTKGGKKGKAQFNYSGYGGIQTHGKLPKMLNTAEYVELYNEAVANDNVDITNTTLKRKPIPAGLDMANTDWLNAIFQNAQIQSHQLSVTGGNEKTLYYISGNYFNQDGIIRNSWYKRYSLRSKLNIDLTDRLSIANNINISYSDKNSVGSSGDGYGGNGGSVVRYALFRTPAIPIFNADGSYSDLPQYPNFFGDGYNPVALAMKTDNKEKQYRVFGNLYAEYKISKSLRFKSDVGADVFATEDKRFDENYGTNLRINSPNRLLVSSATSINLIWNNTLRYFKTINGKHNINVIVGTEAITNKNRIHGGTDRNFPDQLNNLRFLGNGLNITSRTVFENEQKWALFSLFGNANYTYDNRYLLSFNARRDGSSRFGSNNRYANFFSGSAGWNINNEKWMKDMLPNVSKLKLRASIGQLGNQDIGNYPWASIIGRNYNYAFGEQPASNSGYTISSRGNQNVKWESSTQADAGVDIGVWKDKLTMTVDYFIKKTTNMLIPIPLPLIGGSATTPFVNAGSVENKGLEVELNYRNKTGRLNYTISANFATLNNKILSLSDGAPIPGGRIDNGVYATLTTVGHPIGSFYLYEMEGIYQNDADIFKHAYQGSYIRPGDVKFKDQNADGVIDEKDRTYLGSAIPKFTYGFTTTLEYSNFDLSIFFQGAYGNKLYLQVNQDIEGFYRAFNLTQRVYDERWQGEGTSNTMPRVSWLGSANNKTPSSRFLEDGSYLRLKNAQLGYTIPKRIADKAHIKGLRIYITGENLVTITKYTGLDPEMHTSNNLNAEKYGGDVAAGIDWGTYPAARSYIAGVNMNF